MQLTFLPKILDSLNVLISPAADYITLDDFNIELYLNSLSALSS